jgi:hypothetical protein
LTETSANRDRRWFAILAGILLLSLLLRGWAALRLPLDYDEPVYLQAGFDYAQYLSQGDLGGVIDYAENREHPALVKLLYGLVVLALGPETGWQVALYAARLLSALFGLLAALALALFDPLAGGMLAVHTMAVKYTSQAYLEALPLLASLVSVLALHRSSRSRDRWFWLSALALGVTAASKFTYLPIVFVLLYLAIWEKRTRWPDLALYLALSVAVFWLLNPMLWRDPFGRLADTLFFHARYSQGSRVQLAGYPWYQPLTWISRSPPSLWHPDAFFYFALDGVIFLLALPGLYWEWRERRWVVVWIATGLLFLLLWPTKWPQYTLILTPALCLAASAALRNIYHWLRERETYWLWLRQMIPTPPLSFWILGGLLVLAVVLFYTASTLQLTMGRLGWSHFTTGDSHLPSNTVYAVAPDLGAGADIAPGLGAGAGIALATENGAVLWSPRLTTDMPDDWRVLTADNSGLPDDRVRAVVWDGAGHLWFGTEGGLARYDGADWQTYRAADLGLDGERVYALALGSDGRLWVGTNSGATFLDATAPGGRAQAGVPLTAATSGLADDWVTALAVEPHPGGDRVWFGTSSGLSRLDTATGEWHDFTDPIPAGVTALLLGADGRLWVGTQGEGLAVWDGQNWQSYRTGNSDIPFNTVTALAEVDPGVLWVGTASPSEVGGVLARFDGQTWKHFTRQDSGSSMAEPLAIAQDSQGRWWIGTRTSGIDIYQVDR